MLHKSLVSVVVPIYNVEKYLERCVRSLFEQTYSNIEYIFIDDCGQDSSMGILHNLISQYQDRRDQVTIVSHEKNRGLPSARNSGMDVANGDFLYHCDSDDWVEVDLIESMLNKAKEEEADVVYCDFLTLYGNENVTTSLKEYACYEDHVNAFMFNELPGNVFNKLVRRSLYLQNVVRFPDGLSMLEDLRTMVEVFFYAKKIAYLPKCLYNYVRYNPDSISGKTYQKSCVLSRERVENVKGIEFFLISKGIKGLEEGILRLKLGTKGNLLVNGRSIDIYKKWTEVFPESNGYVWKTDLPIQYKVIAWCADVKFWLPIRMWVFVKYKLFRK